MRILKKAVDYLRIKSGIEENRQHLKKMEERHRFLLANIHLAQPEVLNLDKDALESAVQKIRQEFQVQAFKTEIHKNDLMFTFHLWHHSDDLAKAVHSYFKVGARTAQNFRKSVSEQNLPTKNILDFGSGYGRVSRFLPAFFSDSKITVSEVKNQSMLFQKEKFGFQTLAHSSDFKEFPSQKFDLMLALSVFTHLPQALFEGWLAALYENLQPGGGLVFTYKDLKERGHHADEKTVISRDQDFVYTTQSEDELFSFVPDSLKSDEYGLTLVTQDYLKKQAKKLNGKMVFLDNDFTVVQDAAILIKPA